MKHLICWDFSGNGFNAEGKAPSDITTILTSEGFHPIHIDYFRHGKAGRYLRLPLIPLSIYSSVSEGDTLIFQHPYHTAHNAVKLMNRISFRLLRRKKTRTVAIVHDLTSLRGTPLALEEEVKLLNSYDCLIVHSPEMKDVVMEAGYKGECRILGLFDYLVGTCPAGDRALSKEVVFAGNPDKSPFLKQLDSHMLGNLTLRLYGKSSATEEWGGAIRYCGFFKPEDLSTIEGSWGLVWDGDSAEALSSEPGRYLKYISPHKASLYVCAGLPVIAPEGSALARIVKEKGIGICVSSLSELEEAIKKVSEDEYRGYLRNLELMASRLKKGRSILNALS